MDFECPLGTVVVAANDGEVVFVKDDSDKVITIEEYRLAKAEGAENALIEGSTNIVGIKHGDGTYTEYSHLGKGTAVVKVGDKVAKGQPIAATGLSGCMGGPHLHFNRFRVVGEEGKRTAESLQFEMVRVTKDQVEKTLKDLW